MDREELRDAIDSALDVPMAILAFIALVLIVIDLTAAVSPAYTTAVEVVYWLVWSAFVGEFVVKLLLSRNKRLYIRQHWVELALVAVPFLRIFRVLRIARATRSVALLRFFLYTRLGLSELGKILSRRLTYLVVTTALVTLFGAIGGLVLESRVPGTNMKTFGDALWWSTGLVTTVTDEIHPVTPGGRILGFFLMVFGMTVFAFLAASFAAFLFGKKGEEAPSKPKSPGENDDDEKGRDAGLLARLPVHLYTGNHATFAGVSLLNNLPIGVFDSGVGGLTVVNSIMGRLPSESIIYLGDTARVPYGPRDLEEVKGFVLQIADFLVRQDVKLIVIACNTGTAAGLSPAQERFGVPITGVIEPGARAAALATRTRRVGVVGTAGTIASSAYTRALHMFDAGLEIYTRACPEFVDFVEAGEVAGDRIERLAHQYLDAFLRSGVDAVILGCTHYPLLAETIGKVMGHGVQLISSADETAREVEEILGRRDHLRSGGRQKHRFIATGDPEQFRLLGSRFLDRRIDIVEKVNLP
ncbi:MAG: glutamate racemase [Actinobacteria bacterium]|nr:MAG: glutamate racemase [Actinomycetota bacterium]